MKEVGGKKYPSGFSDSCQLSCFLYSVHTFSRDRHEKVACSSRATSSKKPTVFTGETVGFCIFRGGVKGPVCGLDVPGIGINWNLANRNCRTPWLPLWGSWLPRKGQTERATRCVRMPLPSLRHPLSQPVRLTALPKGEPRGAAVFARQITICRASAGF